MKFNICDGVCSAQVPGQGLKTYPYPESFVAPGTLTTVTNVDTGEVTNVVIVRDTLARSCSDCVVNKKLGILNCVEVGCSIYNFHLKAIEDIMETI